MSHIRVASGGGDQRSFLVMRSASLQGMYTPNLQIVGFTNMASVRGRSGHAERSLGLALL